jgi:hypothetical protein
MSTTEERARAAMRAIAGTVHDAPPLRLEPAADELRFPARAPRRPRGSGRQRHWQSWAAPLTAAAMVALAPGPRKPRSTRPAPRWGMRPVIAGALAVAIGGGTAIGVTVARSGHPGQTTANPSRTTAWSGRPAAAWPQSDPSYGRATTAAQLIDYATRASVAGPGRAPQPDEWVVTKFEVAVSSQQGASGIPFGPLDQRRVYLQWHSANGCNNTNSLAFPASLPATKTVTGKLTVSENPDAKYGGATNCLATLYGWKSVTYSYLNSLPTDPVKLEAVILRYNQPGGLLPTPADAVFAAITTLLEDGEPEGVVVPPKLEATFYRILQQLPGVHFENDTDLAGRHGLGFWNLTEGYIKYEIVIDPATYHYMGSKEVAVTDHAETATDGSRHIKAGQVLNWQALLGDAIVRHAGQLP